MLRRKPDRALRRAVADLARLHPDDMRAILDALDGPEKARVDALIAEFSGAAPPAPAPAPEPAWRYESVSPWLLARLDPDEPPGRRRGRDFVLVTEAARAALREAAAPFRTQAGGGDGKRRTLAGQVWRALARPSA